MAPIPGSRSATAATGPSRAIEERLSGAVFSWFNRGDDFVSYEARRLDTGLYELRFVNVDGGERVELFENEQLLNDRQRELERSLAVDGWTGPHGWNL